MNNLMPIHVYVLIGIGALVAMLVILRVLRVQWRLVVFSTLAMAFVVAIGGFLVRSSRVETGNTHSIQDMLGNGKPTFVEFFSSACLECISPQMTADSVISTIAKDFNIVHVDTQSEIGREFRDQYHFSDSPEYALFDSKGQEVWRAQIPPSAQELSLAMNTPIAPGKS